VSVLLITGGAGFIGSNLVDYALAETSHRLVVVDKLTYAGSLLNLEQALKDPRVTFVREDIADKDAMTRVFADARPDAVLNLAAETHVDRSIDRPQLFIDTNIVGTFTLLETARTMSRPLGPLTHIGSAFCTYLTDEVYGALGPTGLFTEETPYAPNSPYAASKAAADHLVRAYFHTYGLPAVITNCSNNYGPYHFPEKLIPLTIIKGLKGEPMPVYGDGGNVRDTSRRRSRRPAARARSRATGAYLLCRRR
jgi:dTDP-glucose 4,6-dehydratase